MMPSVISNTPAIVRDCKLAEHQDTEQKRKKGFQSHHH